MSESVEIKKNIIFDVQVDLVECNGCGAALNFSASVDNLGDIEIYVEPHNCEDE
jgi:hypothetical protein